MIYTFQKNRGTPRAGPRTRIPFEPEDPKFWETYRHLLRGKVVDEFSVAAMVRGYCASPAFKDLRDATRRDYTRYLDTFEQRLGEYAAKAVTTPVLANMLDGMGDTPVAANHMRSIVKTLYMWGIPRGFATVNPADNIRPYKVVSEGAKPWPLPIFGLIGEHARWEVRTFVALGLYTGQRSADILQMRVSDIDAGLIPVRQSKTGKTLMIPIHRDLRPIVEECRRRAIGQAFMVFGPKGDALDTNRWRALWGREIARDVFKPIRDLGLSPHGLRKTACVTLRQIGLSVELIQSITGQSRPMVELYCRDYDQESMARQAIKLWEAGVQTAPENGGF